MKQRVVVTLCDECGKDKPTTLVRIGTDGSLRRLDLCEQCVAPARILLDLAERTRPKRRSVTSMPLMSIEDVLKRRAARSRRALRRPETGLGSTQTPTPVPQYPPRSESLAGPHSANPVFSNGSGQISQEGDSHG